MVDLQDAQKLIEQEDRYVPDKPSLLRQYGIPIGNLDFDYIKKCTNPREVEKIYHVLQSGEEGYFPDLLKTAEEKLTQLKPNSKHIRKSTPVLSKESLDKKEQNNLSNDLNNWLDEVNKNAKELDKFKSCSFKKDFPAIRKGKELQIDKNKNESVKRIKSTDYESWDKYDVDTEILKMDLEEEKLKKEMGKKEKENPKGKKVVRINEFATNAEAVFEGNREKEKGNEFFKSEEYTEAFRHYTNSINYNPCAAAYTNRAITNIKLKKYHEAINDCMQALKYEPCNFKAYLRLAQSHEKLNNYEESLDYIEEAINIDPNNNVAQELAERVRMLSGQVVKKNVRMKIIDIETENSTKVMKPNEVSSMKPNKSILKKPQVNTDTIIPIPGPSTMLPPYYVTVAGQNPQDIMVAQREVLLSTRRKMLCMPLIDVEPDDDVEALEKENNNKGNLKMYPARSKSNTFKKRGRKLEEIATASISSEAESKQIFTNRTSNIKDTNRHSISFKQCKNVLNNIVKDKEFIKVTDKKQNSCNVNGIEKFDGNEDKIHKIKNSKKEYSEVKHAENKKAGNSGNAHRNGHTVNINGTFDTIQVRKDDKGGGGEPYIEQQPADIATSQELLSPFTFLKTWNSISRDVTFTQHAEVLRKIDMNRLGEVIGCKLDSTMLSSILQCLYKHFTVASEIDRVQTALLHLARMPRFNIMVMFMSPTDRICVQNLLEFLDQHDKPLPNDVKKIYCP